MNERSIWRGMTQQELLAQYQTELSVGAVEEEAYLTRYVQKSETYRAIHGEPIIESYGPTEAETVRIFQSELAGARPAVINIKGGYWRIAGAEWVDFVAAGLNPLGITVINVDYGTMPTLTMEALVGQVAKATQWVLDNSERYEIDPENIHMVGHSAGGHLAAAMRGIQGISPDAIKSTTCVSGVFDLGFALHGHLSMGDRAIQLDEEQAQRFSPITMTPRGDGPISLLVGERETPEFHRQAKELAEVWSQRGASCEYQSRPGEHHYSLYFGLHKPDSSISQLLEDKVARSTT